jgi:hypothetical protein
VVDFWNPLAVLAARSLGLPIVTVIQADAHPASAASVWWKPAPPHLPTAVPVVNRVLATLWAASHSLARRALPRGPHARRRHTRDRPLPRGADVTYIGPALWQQEDAELPGWADRAVARSTRGLGLLGNPRYGGSDGRSIHEVILHATVAALGGTATQVVLSTGHHPLPRGNVAAAGERPLRALRPWARDGSAERRLIHHGGYGSCQTGLITGKPAVILPTYSERESNARRIAALGAGLLVEVATRGKEKSSTSRPCATPSVGCSTSRASRFGRASSATGCARYGGPAYAATIIEGVCPRRQRTSTVRVVKSLVQASPPAPSGSNSVERTDNGRASGSSP